MQKKNRPQGGGQIRRRFAACVIVRSQAHGEEAVLFVPSDKTASRTPIIMYMGAVRPVSGCGMCIK